MVCVTDCELAHIGHAAVQGEDKDDGTHGFQGAPDIWTVLQISLLCFSVQLENSIY